MIFFSQMVFINNFFDLKDTKIKTAPSCLPRRASSEHVLFDLAGSISKLGLRPCQA